MGVMQLPIKGSQGVLAMPELEGARKQPPGTSLVVQWVRLHAPNAGGPGSIPGRGTRSRIHAASESPHAATKDPT